MAYRRCFLIVLAALWGTAGSVSAVRADEVTYWNGLALDIIQQSATQPTNASRDLAILQASIFDALNAIDRTCRPLYYQPPVAGPASREAAVAAAAYQSLASLFPSYQATLNRALATRLAELPHGVAQNNGVALGQDVANYILAERAADGWNVNYAYEGSTDVGKWRPTPPANKPGLQPAWGNVRPFAIPSAAAFTPGPPPAVTSPQYAAAVNEVKLLGAANSTVRTPDQTQIAQFWSDLTGQTATPPGKWNLIAQTLALRQQNTLSENARMFALLNLALADAGIVAWDAKYTYELWRPITAIPLADTDGNPATQADPEWKPLLTTPPFPEYVSGHSTFSAAAAEVLGLFFGTDNISFEVPAGFDVLPGVTRSFSSFSQAAQEAGRSRIYAGIHYQFSNLAGQESGREIGLYVCEHFAQPIPAPGAAVLAGLGVLCLLGWRRPRRSRLPPGRKS